MKIQKLLVWVLHSLSYWFPLLLLFKFFIFCLSLSIAIWHMYRETNNLLLVEATLVFTVLWMSQYFVVFVDTVSKH